MRGCVMAALAGLGLSGAASAQSLSVTVTFDATSAAIGEVFTATMYASFSGHAPGAYLSSINIDLIASTDFNVISVQPIAWNNPLLGFDGQPTIDGADLLGVEAAQFSLIPPVTSGSPLVITTWQIQMTNGRPFFYTARVADGAPYPFSVTGGFFSDPAVAYGLEVFSSSTIVWVPAPGMLGFAAVAGLAALRRRR